MTKVLVTVLLLLGNGLFVGGEFALIASRRTALEPLAATSKRARWALSAMNQIPLMIAGAQLGISKNTVKSRLRSIFAKTGATRQSSLIRMLLDTMVSL